MRHSTTSFLTLFVFQDFEKIWQLKGISVPPPWFLLPSKRDFQKESIQGVHHITANNIQQQSTNSNIKQPSNIKHQTTKRQHNPRSKLPVSALFFGFKNTKNGEFWSHFRVIVKLMANNPKNDLQREAPNQNRRFPYFFLDSKIPKMTNLQIV